MMTHASNTQTSADPIDDLERLQRLEAVNYGRATVALEGFVLNEEVEQLCERYIACEITSDELTLAVERLAATLPD